MTIEKKLANGLIISGLALTLTGCAEETIFNKPAEKDTKEKLTQYMENPQYSNFLNCCIGLVAVGAIVNTYTRKY